MHSKQGFLSFLGYGGISGLRREINSFPSLPATLGSGCDRQSKHCLSSPGNDTGPRDVPRENVSLVCAFRPFLCSQEILGSSQDHEFLTHSPFLPRWRQSLPAGNEGDLGTERPGAGTGNDCRERSRKIQPARSPDLELCGATSLSFPRCPQSREVQPGSPALLPRPPEPELLLALGHGGFHLHAGQQ